MEEEEEEENPTFPSERGDIFSGKTRHTCLPFPKKKRKRSGCGVACSSDGNLYLWGKERGARL